MADTHLYEYNGQTLTREQLEAEVEQEAATLDAEQWLNGKFEFGEWLADSVVTGSVKRLGEDL